MTKEEAIQILADLIDSPFLHTWEKQNKALHMAIEALKGGNAEILNEDFRPKYMQHSPDNGADLISRADAIRLLVDKYKFTTSEATEILSALPSAEAAQGEWVRKYDDKINCYWYECDQCGEYRPRNQFGHEYNSNFCPNCGSRMK